MRMSSHKLCIVMVDSDTVEINCEHCPFHLAYLYSSAVKRGYTKSWDSFCGEAYGTAYEIHASETLRKATARAWKCVGSIKEPQVSSNVLHSPLRNGDELRAVVEADLMLNTTWHDRRGCNCGQHLPQNCVTFKPLEPDHESRAMQELRGEHA